MTGSGIPGRTLLLYALPAFALAMPTLPVYVYLPTFYAQDLGLGMAAIGGALLLARCFDVATDPLVGLLSDRLRLGWGRRKPWIVAGAAIAALGLVRLFHPPEAVGAGYLLLWSLILYLGWTLIAIPYTAWGAELSGDYNERARITGAREAAMVLGVVIAGGLPALAAGLGGSERDGLTAIAWLTIGCGAPAIALLVWKVDERPAAPALRPDWAEVRAIARNRPFVRLLTGWFVNGLANGLPAVLFPLYLQYGLGAGPVERGVLILAYFLTAIAGIPLWLRLSRRHGKHRVWCWAMLLACAAFVWVPFLDSGAIAAFFVICIVTGFALGADLALPPAMQADVVDLDSLRTGRERAGLFFALWGMATKLALALAVGIAFPALAALGFAPGEGNDSRAILALAVFYALVPTALKLAAVLVIWRHPLTARRQQVIQRRLKARAARAVRLQAGTGALDDFLGNTADDQQAGRPTVSPQGPEH